MEERKALLENNLFDSKPIIISCFFHFAQCLYKKMKEVKLIKSKIGKYNFEILRNAELVCFINPKLIRHYSQFLKEKLKKDEEILFYNYLEKTWLKKDYKIYNYYAIIDDNNNDDKNLIMNHIFLTNNIEESLHSKINFYIPKKI